MSPRPRSALLLLVPAALFLLALTGPVLAPYGAGELVGVPFSTAHGGFLGTDHLGRDAWSRVLHGGRPIVVVPVVATMLATLVGGSLGVLAAALGRRTGGAVMRVLDVVVVLPPVLVLLVLLSRSEDRTATLVATVVIVSTPFVARFARAAAVPVLTSGYVEQATAMGAGRVTVLVREVVPNLAGPLLADAGLRFVGAVYLVASAGFLGYGPTSPATDWGSMIAENIDGAALNPWPVVAPCIAVAALTVTSNLAADRVARRIAR